MDSAAQLPAVPGANLRSADSARSRALSGRTLGRLEKPLQPEEPPLEKLRAHVSKGQQYGGAQSSLQRYRRPMRSKPARQLQLGAVADQAPTGVASCRQFVKCFGRPRKPEPGSDRQLHDGRAFDDDAGKAPGRERPGVDIDPVRPQIRYAYRRVAVDNKPFERLFVGEKLLADPEQIVFCLFVDGNAGPNTGMDKQEIAAAVKEIERIQKVQVLPWKGDRQLVGQPDLFMPVGTDGWLEAVGQQRLKTAVLPPFVQSSRIGEKAWQECFVVAAQKDRLVIQSPP